MPDHKGIMPLTTRLKRYTQVSTTLTGLAARIVGEKYFGVEIARSQHAHELRSILGNLKGPLMKVAQFLATVPGALPSEYAEEFLTLQAQAPAMGRAFVRRRMQQELGFNWRKYFKEFNEIAVSAASLGQVHYAITTEGAHVACKLQYPNMRATIEADLNQLGLALSLYERTNTALKTAEIRKEIEEHLYAELDYNQEAHNLTLFGQIFQDDPDIHVPQVFPELSTQRLLTMDWVSGVSLLEKVHAPQEARNRMGATLFRAWYKPLYQHGILHADPHPGNYRITEDGKLHLLDFGCVRHFSKSFVQGILLLYDALKNDNTQKLQEAYEAWGFQDMSPQAMEAMTHWARLLYDPILDNRVRLIQEDLTGSHSWDTAVKVHNMLKNIGGITPPREFVFMDRAAVGIGSVLMHLKAENNWNHLFEKIFR